MPVADLPPTHVIGFMAGLCTFWHERARQVFGMTSRSGAGRSDDGKRRSAPCGEDTAFLPSSPGARSASRGSSGTCGAPVWIPACAGMTSNKERAPSAMTPKRRARVVRGSSLPGGVIARGTPAAFGILWRGGTDADAIVCAASGSIAGGEPMQHVLVEADSFLPGVAREPCVHTAWHAHHEFAVVVGHGRMG